MAWWQKKLLRYALSRTGFLDDAAIDLDNLDVTFGKQNVFQFKDVGLNIKRISKLAQLPPSLRIETARILSLRLTVPADIYQSSIVAEVDGVELSLKLEEQEHDETSFRDKTGRARSPITTRSPQHRKMHRRLHSPPAYDPGGLADSGEGHLPTTEEMAKSFLMDEPLRERKQLEASVAAQTRGMEESVASESSEGADYGTGAAIGVPGFLAGFLQGIMDRLQVQVKNIQARVEIEVAGDGGHSVPVTLELHVGDVDFGAVPSSDAPDAFSTGNDQHPEQRRVKLSEIYLNLLSEADVFSELSELPSRSSPSASRQQTPSALRSFSHTDMSVSPRRPSTSSTRRGSTGSISGSKAPASPDAMRASVITADADRFADAGDDAFSPTMPTRDTDLDIQPGDDNISWGSRRSKSNAPVEDLWNSMASEDELPDSLLLDRASTPRAPSTRSVSPAVTRTRRDVSPYSRQLQSPGSWPRMEESQERVSLRESPGSWPNLDQSQHGIFESMDAKATAPVEEDIAHRDDGLSAPIEENVIERARDLSPTEDLAASRVFSHEEAESMFMSAISHPNIASRSMHVPGGWSSDSTPSAPSSPIQERQSLASSHRLQETDVDDGLAYGNFPPEPAATKSGQATPRVVSPTQSAPLAGALNFRRAQSAKKILQVDTISIWLPAALNEDQGETAASRPAPRTVSDSFAPPGIPGTFSAYSEMSASRFQKTASFTRESSERSSVLEASSPAPKQQASQRKPGVSVEVGSVSCQVDVPCIRLLYRMSLQTTAALESVQIDKSQAPRKDQRPEDCRADLTVKLRQVHIAFRERIDSSLYVNQKSTALLALLIADTRVVSSSVDLDLQMRTFEMSLGDRRLLGFDKSRQMSSSIVVSESTPEISVKVKDRMTTTRRVVKDIDFQTMPIDLSLDLVGFDETFSAFGGLSGVLEAGNSILSESGLTSSPPSPRVSKGVRFEGQPVQQEAGPDIRLSGVIGGLEALLQGETCNVQLRTTRINMLYRESSASLAVSHAILSGPYELHAGTDQPAAISVDLSSTRLDYQISPQEKDLDRLLSLLTPSKDKYDTDDDILIDTLLRQRRKGAVARITTGDVRINVNDLDKLSALHDLANELSKLSAVAKYLPEDERPGLLSLVRIKTVEARLPVNERFGKIHINLGDVHCAHVGLPALLALAVGNAHASQDGRTEIVHSLLPTESLPMIMMRMLGDEAEPVIKVKLFNLCVEYSVPVLLAATGLDQEAAPEEVVAELSKSIAALPLAQGKSHERSAPEDDSPGREKKNITIELLVHESAVGLQPQKILSKGMLVLTDARFVTSVPPEETMTAQLQLRKAGVFVADEVHIENAEESLPYRGAPPNTATTPRLTTALSKRGFVSVGSVMSAHVAIRVVESTAAGGKSVDVDVRNELLLLETCADSTQTLIAVMNGLAPPTPPSKQPKYLTEPMTIEDMMASFSGEPEVKNEQPPETLFDAEAAMDDEEDTMLDMPGFDDVDDGLLAESEMQASLYGPVSGMLEGVDKPEDEEGSDVFPETAESLLEDDPFEMPDTPVDARMSDAALFRELNKQCKPSLNAKPVDLGAYEIDDLGFDALGGGQQPLGSQHRFNTPSPRKKHSKARKEIDLPFKLRLRDLHIIWNIYDGYDWKRTREGITETVEQVEQQAEERKARRRQSQNEREDEESVIGDFLFNSIYIGIPSNHDAQELRRQINKGIDELASETESVPMSGVSRPTTAYSASGRPLRQKQRRRLKLERTTSHKVAFELKGVCADILIHPPDDPDTVSTSDIRVKDFEIFDNVLSSSWRKFLTHMESDLAAREMSKPMMHIEMLNVKTLEHYAASEIVMHVSVLPIRLHVDQDALDFITRFFEFKDPSIAGSDSPNDQPFLQRVEVDTVDMNLSYKPKHVDYGGLRSGYYTEFKNFIILEEANIKLKHAIIYGIKGFEPLHQTLNDVWMPDIKRNQLPTVLAGLAPVRSLVNIGAGMRDVVAIPVREYRKDGRVVRSIQKGAMHFGKTTTSELARLGAKVAMGTQTFLSGAEGLLSPASASPRSGSGHRISAEQDSADDDGTAEKRAISAYANQPLGVFSGLRSARRQLELDLLTAKDALIAVQGEMLESSTPGSAAVAVARHAPTVVLRPVIGASRAVGTALLGVGNQIDRSNVRKVDDKYKHR